MMTETKRQTVVTMYRRAVEEGDRQKAGIIEAVAALLAPDLDLGSASRNVPPRIRPSDGMEFTQGSEPSEESTYRVFEAELDGSAARARNQERIRREQIEREQYERENYLATGSPLPRNME